MRYGLFTRIFNKIDSRLKFPNLREGEIGVQVGFDLSSANLTTDVLRMAHRVGPSGLVVAIDPDPANHASMQKVIDHLNLNVILVQKGTHARRTSEKLILGTRASFNIIASHQAEVAKSHTDETIEVELEPLDDILAALGDKIDYARIKHISITNNGVEYDTLLGMEHILEKCPNLNLTLASGRPNKLGIINGRPDHVVITEFLEERGFTCRLLRLNKSFWAGFVIGLLKKRQWLFSKKRFGFLMASRGDRKLKWYQSFS